VPLTDIIRVTSGDNHSCALSARGDAWCWGATALNNLGQFNPTLSSPSPTAYRFAFPN
jgi:alpha-tubulin suppressor-like RCC1 family protein